MAHLLRATPAVGAAPRLGKQRGSRRNWMFDWLYGLVSNDLAIDLGTATTLV